MKVHSVCVIGGGAAGTMAVLRTVLNNDECLFFPGSPKDKKKSRALWVRKVENMPAHLNYTRGIEEPNAETIAWIQNSDFKDKLLLHKNTGVVSLKNRGEFFEITDSKGNIFASQNVVLCTGVMDVQPLIDGKIEEVFDYANAQTIDYCLICDGHHVINKKTSVIGHTTSAAWVAIILFERYRSGDFHILTNGNEPSFSEETSKLLQDYGIKIVTEPIKKIIGEEKGKLLGFKYDNGSIIESDICFVALGMIVYNDLALQVGADVDERGFVKTNDTGESSVKGLFIAGDLKANSRKQIYTAWDSAVTAVTAINQRLRANSRGK